MIHRPVISVVMGLGLTGTAMADDPDRIGTIKSQARNQDCWADHRSHPPLDLDDDEWRMISQCLLEELEAVNICTDRSSETWSSSGLYVGEDVFGFVDRWLADAPASLSAWAAPHQSKIAFRLSDRERYCDPEDRSVCDARIKLAYDRSVFSGEPLRVPDGCEDALRRYDDRFVREGR